MVPAMAGNLMTRLDCAADKGGEALRNPSEREESRFDAALFEQVDDGVAVALDALFEPVPFGAAQATLVR
jgi:hypothetical protein